jgi:tRNA (guanine-N7-)-methyltransferase
MSTTINIKELPTLLPHNVDWGHFFGNHNPVDLEIGCGRTHFFFDRALNFPERNIVGIEWKYEFIEQAQRRIIRDHMSNAVAFHGNAWLLVPLLFSSPSISQVFVNFPDPWWKERHKKRLVLNEIFLHALHERMRDDGFILLQTDVKDLFDFYKELIVQHGFVFDQSLTDEDLIQETKAQTHREKKCLEQGSPIYRGLFHKKK